MQIEIPSGAQDIDVRWMESALADHLGETKIVGVEAKQLSDPGQTSEAIDIEVTFDRPHEHLPDRFLAKLGSNDPSVLSMIDTFGQYRREVDFYRQFPDVGISKPTCYFSAYDSSGLRMVLLFDHLAPSECPSWTPNLAQIELAMGMLPAFHARWWKDPTLNDIDCLIPPRHDFFMHLFKGAASGADQVRSEFGDEADACIACIAVVAENLEAWRSYVERRHFTICHGDYHGKQMFMQSSVGGRFCLIDWQFPLLGEGPWDVARLATLCVDSDHWKRNGERILADYYQALVALGIEDYSFDAMLDAFRMGAIISASINTIAFVSTDMDILDRECRPLGLDWKDLVFRRCNRTLTDMDAKAFIQDALIV